jgi:hypothetical protein
MKYVMDKMKKVLTRHVLLLSQDKLSIDLIPMDSVSRFKLVLTVELCYDMEKSQERGTTKHNQDIGMFNGQTLAVQWQKL